MTIGVRYVGRKVPPGKMPKQKPGRGVLGPEHATKPHATKPQARKLQSTKPHATKLQSTKLQSTKPQARKNTKHVEALLALPPEECCDFFEKGMSEQMLEVVDESYVADLVNLLLDLKKATVKRLFETLGSVRKRSIGDIATLYYYNQYLTNPVPLQIELEVGHLVPNYYAILGVPRDVDDEDLKTAYRLLVKAHSPEIFAPAIRKSAEDRLKDIYEAFDNLKTPQRRDRTDKVLPNMSYLYPRRDQFWLEAVQRVVG
jgi:hypothetical protein